MERVEHLEKFSLALFHVLDIVGASQYIRCTRRHAVTVEEILISIVQNAVRHVGGFTHVFGSAAEGTSTPGLQSDIDTVVSVAKPIVVERLADTKATRCLLMIQDETTPPGYTKLLLVEDGNLPPNCVTRSEDEAIDLHGRPVLKNNSLIDAMTYDERKGPAGTTLYERALPDLDFVPAFRGKKWPSQASAWLNKQRPYSFPSANVSEDFQKYGFFVVSVGQPSSAEKPLEWRLSFSIQERMMMSGLNPLAFKCYVVLKMIKHDFIKPKVEGKSLTSYHCKTCLFYTLERTNPELVVPKNFVAFLMKCMNTLVLWLTQGFLPNFFIPEENMWKGSTSSRLHVAHIIRGLLNDSPEFLNYITCDCTGTLLYKQLHLDGNNDVKCKPKQDTTNAPNQLLEHCGDENGQQSTVFLKGCEPVDASAEDEVLDTDDDSFIVDAIVEALSMKGDNTETLDELRNMLPGADKIIEDIRNTLAEDIPKLSDEFASFPDSRDECVDPVDERLAQQQRKVDVSLYKWHYWTADYVYYVAKELIETTLIDNIKYDIDQCIDHHRELIKWLQNISDLSPCMEFSKLDFQIAKGYLLPFIFTSLGSQLAAKAYKEENEICIEESRKVLEMGHNSDALSGKIKHAAILYMQGKYEQAEGILDDLNEHMESYVTSWGRCYRHVDTVHELLCNRIRDLHMSTQEVVQEGVAACVTYLPTEIDIVPKDLKFEMYRSVFATTPRDKHGESWFDFAVIDAKVYMYYLLYLVFARSGDQRDQGAMMLFLVKTLETEQNLGHPETAQNILGCMLKDQGYQSAAWTAFAESWVLHPDHNSAKWHMCIMIAEAVAQLQANGEDTRPQASEDIVEILYTRLS